MTTQIFALGVTLVIVGLLQVLTLGLFGTPKSIVTTTFAAGVALIALVVVFA